MIVRASGSNSVASPLLGLAIVVNNRRLAWVIAVGGIAYLLFTANQSVRQRVRPLAVVAIPIVVLYVALGLVAPESRIFAPVQSLESVVTGDDRSSQTREHRELQPRLDDAVQFPASLGYGNPYIESVVGDDISVAFPQYRHLPHNSLLGMFMLVGPVGVALLLSPLVFGVACSHWLRRFRPISGDVQVQTTVIMAVWIGFLVGAWGDLGLALHRAPICAGRRRKRARSRATRAVLVASTGQKLQS